MPDDIDQKVDGSGNAFSGSGDALYKPTYNIFPPDTASSEPPRPPSPSLQLQISRLPRILLLDGLESLQYPLGGACERQKDRAWMQMTESKTASGGAGDQDHGRIHAFAPSSSPFRFILLIPFRDNV